MKTRALLILIATFLTTGGRAQYATGVHYSPLSLAAPEGAQPCARTWYDPDIYLMPDGSDLGLLAQSSAPTPCTAVAIDTFQPATRNGSTGAWTTPAQFEGLNSCPAMMGLYSRCGFEPWVHPGPIASPSVVRLPNPASPTGVRYYMAFVGGNADYIHGKIYWAVSDDGRTWTVYARGATEYWAPVIQAKYLRSLEAPRSAPSCESPSGIGQVQLAFENGLFYVFLQYWHPIQPECAGGPDSPGCASSPYGGYDRALSSVLLRFDYNPLHPFGFGPSVREVYLDGTWQRHSFKLVWRYDVDAAGAQLPPDAGSPVMELYNGIQAANFGFGPGDIERGNDRWLRVYEFEGITRAQTTTSLDPTISQWSVPQVVDTASIAAAYPLADYDVTAGIWYGALSGTPARWYLWLPVAMSPARCGTLERPNYYAALSLVPAVLCTPDTPCE